MMWNLAQMRNETDEFYLCGNILRIILSTMDMTLSNIGRCTSLPVAKIINDLNLNMSKSLRVTPYGIL